MFVLFCEELNFRILTNNHFSRKARFLYLRQKTFSCGGKFSYTYFRQKSVIAKVIFGFFVFSFLEKLQSFSLIFSRNFCKNLFSTQLYSGQVFGGSFFYVVLNVFSRLVGIKSPCSEKKIFYYLPIKSFKDCLCHISHISSWLF
jgi:hypothetical protein